MTTVARLDHSQPASLSLDLPRLRAQPSANDPFLHVLVPAFLTAEQLALVNRDFPQIGDGGTHWPALLRSGPGFGGLIAAVRSRSFAEAIGEKLGLDLAGRSVIVSVRGYSRAKDGRIHRDSQRKLATALIYLNQGWDDEGGRLRLLRQPRDLEDYVVEVPPDGGTLLAFRCTLDAWHGHRPYVGQRRMLQVNWMTSHGAGLYERCRFLLAYLRRRLGLSRADSY